MTGARHLQVAFTPTGARAAVGAGRGLGLSVHGIGRGWHLAPTPPGTWQASGNQAARRYGQVVETWTNGPAGIEQAFTLPVAPPGAWDFTFRFIVYSLINSHWLPVVRGTIGDTTAVAGGSRSYAFDGISVRGAF